MKPNLLKAMRTQLGWSQSKVAIALGVSTKTVGRWELGLAVPYPYNRGQLACFFNKTIQQLGLLEDADFNKTIQQLGLLEDADKEMAQRSYEIDRKLLAKKAEFLCE
jgi:transcriptional regulator with XRE-family HTH domain